METYASWTQGFRSPGVFARYGAQASQPSVFDRGGFVFVNAVALGDPDLVPERSRSSTFGVVWRPRAGVRLEVSRWAYALSDVVVKESAQAVVDRAGAIDAYAAERARVARDAGGGISAVTLRFVNAPSVATSGFDTRMRAEAAWRGSEWVLSAEWTHTDRYDFRADKTAPVVSALGSTNLNSLARSLPVDQVVVAANVAGRMGRFAVSGRYVSGLHNDRAGVVDRRIGSSTSVGLRYERRVGMDATAAFSVHNLLNEAPPKAEYAFGYDPVTHDPTGRWFGSNSQGGSEMARRLAPD